MPSSSADVLYLLLRCINQRLPSLRSLPFLDAFHAEALGTLDTLSYDERAVLRSNGVARLRYGLMVWVEDFLPEFLACANTYSRLRERLSEESVLAEIAGSKGVDVFYMHLGWLDRRAASDWLFTTLEPLHSALTRLVVEPFLVRRASGAPLPQPVYERHSTDVLGIALARQEQHRHDRAKAAREFTQGPFQDDFATHCMLRTMSRLTSTPYTPLQRGLFQFLRNEVCGVYLPKLRHVCDTDILAFTQDSLRALAINERGVRTSILRFSQGPEAGMLASLRVPVPAVMSEEGELEQGELEEGEIEEGETPVDEDLKKPLATSSAPLPTAPASPSTVAATTSTPATLAVRSSPFSPLRPTPLLPSTPTSAAFPKPSKTSSRTRLGQKNKENLNPMNGPHRSVASSRRHLPY
ncbi:hypothetical protein C8R46DRAFT_179967 [Mycena filopes]|nr:hypothetical protein C8R46DRAFT_179967 [Mycena filopes]